MVLIVIDCQPRYLPEEHEALEVIRAEVAAARQSGVPIIFLEYWSTNETHDCLQRLVAGYDPRRCVTRMKKTWSGAKEVIDACNEFGWAQSRFRVVGAETSRCIAYTVSDINLALPDATIEVVAKGCCDNKKIVWV